MFSVKKAEKAVEFESELKTSYSYSFANSNRQITRLSRGRSVSVFATCRFCQPGRSDFSVRLLKFTKSGFGLFICAKSDLTLTAAGRHQTSYNINACNFSQWHNGTRYDQRDESMKKGQVVTLRVDVAGRQIVYLVDGVPAGPPQTMRISEADLPRLKPAAQIFFPGDSLEIV